MKLQLRVDGSHRSRSHEVLAERVEDTVNVVVDGEEFEAEVEREGDALVVSLDDERFRVRVDEGGATLDGQAIGFTVTQFEPGRGPGEADLVPAEGRVEPPMPGKILDVLVSAGDEVETGEVLATLEAMKMQSEIEAPRSGTVLSVHVEAGEAVEGHQVLFEIGDPDEA